MERTRLYRQMEEKGVSGLKLAAKTGIAPADISRAKNGYLKLYPSQAERVARALGWKGDPAELFEEVIE